MCAQCSLTWRIKAFDSVPRQPLINKLHGYSFDLNTLAWIHSYLTNRKQHDVVGASASSDMHIVSGIPQGSVLGPLLFLICIYIDDISTISLSEGSTSISLLMTRFSKIINQLQSDIYKAHEWVSSNALTLKCKFMFVTRKRNPTPHLHLSWCLPWELRCLSFTGQVMVNSHWLHICSKGRKLIGLLA